MPPLQPTFVHWTSADKNGATGILGDAAVTLAGPMGTAFYLHDDYPNFAQEEFTPRLPATGMVEIARPVGPGHTFFSLTFDVALQDPIFHLGSLGSTLTFSPGTAVSRLSGDAHFDVAGNVVTGGKAVVGPDGTFITFNDSNGSVRLTGTFSTITFTLAPNPDPTTATGWFPDGVFLQIGGTQSSVTSPVELGGNSADVDPPSALINVDNRLSFDRSKGWPPQLTGNSSPVDTVPSLLPYTFADWERYLHIATSHPEVRELLDDGFIWLGCHLLTARGEEAPVQVVIALRNPTAAQIIEVRIAGEAVVDIAIQGPWGHPESPTEMSTAIELVTSHPDHGPSVAGLTGHAILRVPNAPNEPSNGHRCLHVMFTRDDDPFTERLVCYSALVDMQTNQVIASRKSPCEEA